MSVNKILKSAREYIASKTLPALRYNRILYFSLLISGGFAFWLAYEIRFDFQVPDDWSYRQMSLIAYVALGKLLLFYALRGASTNWRYVGIRDLGFVFGYSVTWTIILYLSRYIGDFFLIPRGVIAIDGFLTLVFTGALRIAARVIRESLFLNLRGPRGAPRKRTILIGAGDAGAMVMRESQMNPKSPYSIIAIFDDDSSKVGLSVYGVRVVGSVNQARAYIDEQDVEMAIVAIPSCTGPQMKRILDQLSALNIEVKTLPSVVEIIESGSALNQLRDVDITDLLGRAEIYIDESSVSELLTDKVIAVTGAGGSIGRELCRQIIKKRPHALVMLDKTENSLFHVHMDLKSMGPDYENVILDMALCDIRYWPEVFDIFSRTKPDVVFHAAAHKHVTIQENNPLECFKNNVGGIQSVTRICDELSIEKFVLISTDKAVNATSIMGASKRACEMYCQAMSRISRTQFITVRFGNVLGSEGSVAPIFMNQIKRGGPVTVTHPQATRYFMTIPEAVTLVLQAASIGETGNVMLLDMGEPRKILDMAKQLIRLHGKSETTIPIEFIGLKPGEKLHEELSFDVEKLLPTAHEKVKLFESNIDDPQRVLEQIDHWIDMAFTAPYTINMQSVFKEIVPEYKPAHSNGDSQGLQLGPTAQPAFMGARSSLKYGDMI